MWQAKEKQQQEYLDKLKNISKKDLAYIDESGIDMNINKDKGWGAKGKKLKAKKSGKYYQRTNIIAGLYQQKKHSTYGI